MPSTALSVLDLPAPLAPISASVSPGSIASGRRLRCRRSARSVTSRSSMLSLGIALAEIGFDHGALRSTSCGLPCASSCALGHHQHAVAQVGDEPHVVVDDDDGDAAFAHAAGWCRARDPSPRRTGRRPARRAGSARGRAASADAHAQHLLDAVGQVARDLVGDAASRSSHCITSVYVLVGASHASRAQRACRAVSPRGPDRCRGRRRACRFSRTVWAP